MTRWITVLLVVLPALASAQFVPASGDLQANSFTAGYQYETVVGANPSTGEFVVVWTSESQDGNGGGVFAQRYDSAGGAAGTEFQVNTATIGGQYQPAVAVEPLSGDFVVTWASSFGSAVFAQRFDSVGNALGGEFQVNGYNANAQRRPVVAMEPDGAFVIAWQSSGQDGDLDGVFARRHDSDGTPLGTEFQVNSFTTSSQREPAIGIDPLGGGFTVAWASAGDQDGDGTGVFARRYDSGGTPLTSEFQVNSVTLYDQTDAAVGFGPNGEFVVAWASENLDGDEYGIFAQRYDSAGAPVAGEFQVNSHTLDYQQLPSVAVDPSGSFVVSWDGADQDHSRDGIFGQRYDSTGAAVGTEFRVNAFGYDDQYDAAIAARGVASFVVAWTDDAGLDGCVPGRNGVFAQLYDSDGTAIGAEFQVNSYTIGSQQGPDVQSVDSGNFVVTWSSFSQDGNRSGVFAQRLDSAGARLGGEFQVNTFTGDYQAYAAVGGSVNGFVVGWQSEEQDGDRDGVFAQPFDVSGNLVGSEFQVNAFTANSQFDVAVGVSVLTGDAVVAWTSSGGSSGIFARRFDSAGGPIGGEFQVNSYTTSGQYYPAVAVDPSGAFVVAWSSSQDGSVSGVFAQRFDSAGSAVAGEFQVNSFTAGIQRDVEVRADSSGSFVFAWESNGQDGSTFGVFAKRYDSAGAVIGGEFQVNVRTSGNQNDPVVGADIGGGFVVAWESPNNADGSDSGTFARLYDSAGTAIGGEFQVNSYTTYSQTSPAVAADPASGRFVVVWESYQQDGCYPSSYGGAFFRLFAEVTPTPTITGTATATLTASVTATPTAGTVALCPPSPAMGCATPAKGKLIVKDNTDDAKDKLVWKFGKGPLLAQGDFGDPTAGDGYAFCVYDDGTLKVDLTIPAGMPWEALSTKGYQYKDKTGANDSVTKVKLIGGDAGKSKLQLKGKGAGLAVPAPVSGTQLLSGTTSVVAQLHGNGSCWETSFTTVQSKHKVNSYKGKF